MIADGVKQGYSEAMISAQVWKPMGSFGRGWAEERARKNVVAGDAIPAWVQSLASRYPRNVKVH